VLIYLQASWSGDRLLGISCDIAWLCGPRPWLGGAWSGPLEQFGQGHEIGDFGPQGGFVVGTSSRPVDPCHRDAELVGPCKIARQGVPDMQRRTWRDTKKLQRLGEQLGTRLGRSERPRS
jgi:hypothetical protein